MACSTLKAALVAAVAVASAGVVLAPPAHAKVAVTVRKTAPAGPIQMRVGERSIVHIVHPTVCLRPPSWQSTVVGLPNTSLGRFSDGGVTRRSSLHCGAVIPVRSVAFTALRPGTDTWIIAGQEVTVTVDPADVGRRRTVLTVGY